MSDEKGGSIVFILLMIVCAILWSNQPTKPRVEPSPMPSDLIEQVASVNEYIGISDDHETDFAIINHFHDVSKIDDPKPVPSPSDKPSKPEIIIFTSASCPPCERWKKCEAAKFEANGWKVLYCEQHDYPLTPAFLITRDGKTVERVGFFTFEQLGEVWK